MLSNVSVEQVRGPTLTVSGTAEAVTVAPFLVHSIYYAETKARDLSC